MPARSRRARSRECRLKSGGKKAKLTDEEYQLVARDTVKNASWGVFFQPKFGSFGDIEQAALHGAFFIRVGTDIDKIREGREFILFAKEKGLITQKQAQTFLQKAVAEQHQQAIVELGLWHYAGRLVAEDRNKAMELWRRAAALGNKEAKIRLAVLMIQTASAPQQRESACSEIASAAQAGSILAQVALAYCYETGIGMPKKKSEAVHLYRIAAQRGSQDAFHALKRMHDEIRPNEKEFQIEEEKL
jgi:TPR repeat protein